MHVRKALTLGTAVLAAGLLTLTATATASTPTGGPVASVMVNGNPSAGTDPINGQHTGSGGYTLGGASYTCTAGGSIGGTARRGTHPLGTGLHDLTFTSLNLSCGSSWGPATMTLVPGCSITADFTDGTTPNVHDGTVDTGTGTKFNRVDGTAAVCIKYGIMNGLCVANVVNVGSTVNAYFDENVYTAGGVAYQDLILNGGAMSFVNQSPGCFGLLSGTLALSNMVFALKVTSGTTTGIDFRQT